MPFPIDRQQIEYTEKQLGLVFPNEFINKMTQENGGEFCTDEDNWSLFPFFDQSDNKRISRTCNHILLETNNAKEYASFPLESIAIGDNGCGDYLILKKENSESTKLSDQIFIWRHETGEIEKISEKINDLFE